MAVLLSPVGGVAGQFFDNNGNPLTGGKLYSYVAGTTTPQATYTSSAGTVAHSNPIILDAGGRVPGGEIWLTDGLQYKFVLKNANDVLIGTYDNIIGINSNFVNFLTETEVQTATASQTVFTLTTMQYQPGTNNLTVHVDGVNQIDGSTYSYVETSSTVITFTAGLHVGALVKFTTAQTLSTGVTDSSLVTYDPPFANSVTTTVENKLAQTVSVKDFGAVCDGVTDDTAAIQDAIDYCAANGWPTLVVPGMAYITAPVNINRMVDSTTSEFFIVGSGSNGGFYTDQTINIFSSTIATTSDPLSEFVTFQNVRFAANNVTIDAYCIDGNKFLRMRFSNCYFYKINCAKTNNYFQQYCFNNCNIRYTKGWFLEATIGGTSPLAGSVFNVDWTDNIFEKGSLGVATTGFVKAELQVSGSNFSGGIFEGSYGPFYESAATYGVAFTGIYFEINTDQEIKLGICWSASISGCLFDNPISAGDKYCVNCSNIYNLASNGNYATNKLYFNPPTTLQDWATGLISNGDYAGSSLISNLPGFNGVTGSFTATLSGFTTTVTPTVKYQKSGRIITLSWDDNFATSNLGTMVLTGIPAALLPTGQNVFSAAFVQDNTVLLGMMPAKVNVDGIEFFKSLTGVTGPAFTSSGTKGISAFTMTYRI